MNGNQNKPDSAAPGGDVERRVPTDEQIGRVFMATGIPKKIVAGENIEPKDWFDFGRACVATLSAPKQVGEMDTLGFDFYQHLHRQREWSKRTFGPGPRTAGVVDHIRKELCEIEADPFDLSEWIDVVILALDGAWRAGGTPLQIIETLAAKQTKNEGRKWPDWRTADPDKAIEHDRSVIRAVRDQRPVPLDLHAPADRWRLRIAIYDAAFELVHPERRRPYGELAKAAKMRKEAYIVVHRCATSVLQEALSEGRTEFKKRLQR